MNLLPETLDDRIAEIFGPGFAADLRAAAACIDRNRLREVTPLPWDTTPFPCEVEL